jgi:hypothetical protein
MKNKIFSSHLTVKSVINRIGFQIMKVTLLHRYFTGNFFRKCNHSKISKIDPIKSFITHQI